MQLYSPRHKTAHRALQGLFLQFYPFHRTRYQTDKSGYNATCATLERITAPQRLHRYQIQPPRRTLYRAAQPPIIIRYIRVQHTADHASGGGVSTDQRETRADPAHLLRGQCLHLYRVSPAGSRYFPRPAACDLAPVSSQGAPAGALYPAEQSSSRGAAGGAEPLTATAVSLFGLSPDS